MELVIEIGARIRSVRRRQRPSGLRDAAHLARTARAADIGARRLRRIETGETEARASEMLRLSQALNVPLAALYPPRLVVDMVYGPSLDQTILALEAVIHPRDRQILVRIRDLARDLVVRLSGDP